MSGFRNRIESVNNKMVDLTWPGGLFEYPEFREIYYDPASYLHQALDALGSNELGEQEKVIVALSMQGLKLSDFLIFANEVLSLLENGHISNNIFTWAVFPTYDWNTNFVDSGSLDDVQKILTRILDSKAVEHERKNYIREELQSGKAKQHIQLLREMGQIKDKS